jgi:hypothetical protein
MSEPITLPAPCPFCGSTTGVVDRVERHGTPPPGALPDEGWWAFSVCCLSCAAQGPWSSTSEANALTMWTRRATVSGSGAKQPGSGGDVWAAILAYLPEGEARDVATSRRNLGLERYGEPLGLRTLDVSLADLREELADATAYGAAVAAHQIAAGDEVAASVTAYDATRDLQRAAGVSDARVGYAIWRAVRKLARGGA